MPQMRGVGRSYRAFGQVLHYGLAAHPRAWQLVKLVRLPCAYDLLFLQGYRVGGGDDSLHVGQGQDLERE